MVARPLAGLDSGFAEFRHGPGGYRLHGTMDAITTLKRFVAAWTDELATTGGALRIVDSHGGP